MNLKEEEKQASAVMTAAQRKQKSRMKKKQIQEGTYEETLLDKAKKALSAMDEPSLANLYSIDTFKGNLTDQDVTKIQTFISNFKAKVRKQEADLARRDLTESAMQEKAKRFTNQLIPDLHRELLNPQSESERGSLIKEKISENLFLFLDYMEDYDPPFPEFLRLIVQLNDQLEPDTFTKLFARVCAQHRGEDIVVTLDMVSRAMEFLHESKINHMAAYGLLRLIYQNSLSLKLVPIEILREFESTYSQSILNFFRSIAGIKSYIIDSLPATIFAFTTPMFRVLKQGGGELHRQMPPVFMPYIVEIVCHSFTDDQISFDLFLQTFKEGCQKHYEKLESKNFQSLLLAILNEIKDMTEKFFGSLNQATLILERTFSLIKEKKIDMFDQPTIYGLVKGGDDSYLQMSSRPSVLKIGPSTALCQAIANLKMQNPLLDLENYPLDSALRSIDIDTFKQIGISQLLPMQQICMNLCTSEHFSGRWFMQYETGQGKTALCLGIAVSRALTGEIVMILNPSDELTFRDHKKASSLTESIAVQVLRLQLGMKLQEGTNYIIYGNTHEVEKELIQNRLLAGRTACLIIDEYDSIFFEGEDSYQKCLLIVKQFETVVGFSGSEIQQYQRWYLQKCYGGSLVNFFRRNIDRQRVQKHKSLVFSNKNLFKDAIVDVCVRQSQEVPVIIISDAHSERFCKILQGKGIAVEDMSNKEASYIESALRVFNKKHEKGYTVYLINENQGRGMDFPSSSEIEQRGGIFVIISALPSYYLQFQQFIGRTGRVSNRGQYQVILFDKNSRNCDAEIYLEKMLEDLKNQDFKKHSDLISRIEGTFVPSGQVDGVNTSEGLADGILTEANLEPALEIPSNIRENQQEDLSNQHPIQEKNDETEEEKSSYNHSDLPNVIDQSQTKKRKLKSEHKKEQSELKILNTQPTNTHYIDAGYFAGYENLEIHKEMLADQVRMNCFKRALGDLCNGKTVIDVGTGTGILSLMALDSGASQVFAIEKSGIAREAEKAFNESHLRYRVTLHQCLAENFKLRRIKADIIVSEWMGYFLLLENMLPSVLDVRDRLLKDGGEMVPRKADIIIAGYCDLDHSILYQGIQRPNEFIPEALVEVCPEGSVCTKLQTIFTLNLCTDRYTGPNFTADIKVQVIRDASVIGLCGWFRCLLAPEIVLDTSPFQEPTHWKQTMFPFPQPIQLAQGDILAMKIEVSAHRENHRALLITINSEPTDTESPFKQTYTLGMQD